MLCGTCVLSKQRFDKLAQNYPKGPKERSPECLVECGGGGGALFQCFFLMLGNPLSQVASWWLNRSLTIRMVDEEMEGELCNICLRQYAAGDEVS